ncbi:MAG TPA: hypothetical protein VHE54_10130 [Puia sp.]|nr:hypothetical protein [Puia sp.]
MKQLYPFALVAATLLLSSCKKEIDYIGHHYNEASPYNIAKITWTQPWGYPDTLTFSYDKWGNPISATRPRPSTGAPTFEFRYDGHHRLTDYIGMYAPPAQAAEFWHRYIYNAHGLIGTDSVYIFPSVINGQMVPTEHTMSRATQLTYDRYDRVIKQSAVPGQYDSVVYTYDAAGNLSGRGPYDDKVNFRRTSKVWMFIDRDYSINNPFIASSYNNAWLPLHFSLTNGETYLGSFLYQNYLQDAYVTYTPAKK